MTQPGLVDTHCHLVLLEERGLLDEALQGARDAGVDQIISVGLNLEDSDRNRAMSERFTGVFFTVGWHPHEKGPPDAAELAALSELLQHPRAVAVGEIGLDAYFRPEYHDTPLEVQLKSIHAMFELAEQHNKPVIIHNRETSDQMLAVFDRWPKVKGVMHCFSGDAAFARQCADRGYAISFSGIVTFTKSEDIQGAAKTVAPDNYMVETDSPYLAPVPFRGRPNLPGYVSATADAVAKLRDQDVDEVRAESTANARRLFRLPTDDLLS